MHLSKYVKNKSVYKIILMFISLMISALVYNLLLVPINLVTGGSGGVAIITDYLYKIDPSTMIMIISIACLILSYMYLGTKVTAGTAIASILYPILVKLTSPITNYIIIDYSDMLVISIFAGVLYGFSNGLMYKTGYTNGGFTIISMILYKYLKIPIATSSTIINGIIVIISAAFFGWTNAMYAIILLYINSIIVNKVLLGISNNKAFYIITTEPNDIKEYIIKTLKHSVTVFDVKGGFLEKKRKVLLTVIPSNEYYRLKEGIKLIDESAFCVVTDSYEVVGGK